MRKSGHGEELSQAMMQLAVLHSLLLSLSEHPTLPPFTCRRRKPSSYHTILSLPRKFPRLEKGITCRTSAFPKPGESNNDSRFRFFVDM